MSSPNAGWRPRHFRRSPNAPGLSRPTLHYYFPTRAELFRYAIDDISPIIAGCIARASREGTLLKQLSTFVLAAHEADFADRSVMAFLVRWRLESERDPSLDVSRKIAGTAMRSFCASMIYAAVERGELADDTPVTAVAEMLVAMLWGVACYAGSTDSSHQMLSLAKQLNQLFAQGLLPPGPRHIRSLTIDPHGPAGDIVDAFGRTWPGLRLVLDKPPDEPIGSGEEAEVVVVSGEDTRERVRDLLYRAYGVASFVDGLGSYDTLDAAARADDGDQHLGKTRNDDTPNSVGGPP
jgi:AcrR family transcriptional regulator